jgi:DNA replication protein DnaC
MSTLESLRSRAHELRLHGLLAHWAEVAHEPWVAPLVQWEEDERARRSLERRINDAHLGSFKTLCDFDWSWPARRDRGAIEELMSLGFLKDAANVVLIGPNGVGKSTLAKNVAHQALVHGRPYGAVHHRRQHARRARGAGQRFGAAPALAPLCLARCVGHR